MNTLRPRCPSCSKKAKAFYIREGNPQRKVKQGYYCKGCEAIVLDDKHELEGDEKC